MSFRSDFVWGAATSAYQIEGAAFDDGRGASVWDMFCRKPGAVWKGHTGDAACDHYHRFREDVGLMREIGLKAYRFSVSWPRVLPTGRGAVSAAGLDFYDHLVDSLLESGIAPWVTLFHWDYPYELYCQGGWLNPDSPAWFAEYTAVLVDRLSDRVRHWMTLNEPQCFIGLGHEVGIHAPGDKLGRREVLRAGHNAMLAHGLAVQTIRARAKTEPLVGWAPVGVTAVPETETEADIAAARTAMFMANPDNALWSNTWFSDPVLLGAYPADLLAHFGADAPTIGPNDFATMQQPLDFYGCNIYHAVVIRAGANGLPELVETRQGGAITLMGWPVVPDAMYWGPKFLQERYGKPIVITENGLSNMDWVAADGCVYDPQRIDFIARYLAAFKRAAADGVDAWGYFHWSLLDNFEWGEGYKQRFGLIHVDFATQKRTIKDSARWYGSIIAENGASLSAVPPQLGEV